MRLSNACRAATRLFALSGMLLAAGVQQAEAGIDDCLKAAYSAASPSDLERAASFAANHSSCLPLFVPPKLVPYVALSGALDAANASGALGKVGLDFGNSYAQCAAKLDPGKTSVKKLMPILKPICNQPGLSAMLKCSDLEADGSDKINAEIASKIPILEMMPCACAAATSGLGVEKLRGLVESTKSCGATLSEVAHYLGEGAKGAYKTGEKIFNKGKEIAKDVGCAVVSPFGGCSKAAPPSGTSEAEKFCKSEGGAVKGMKSVTNAPNDFDVVCTNHAACSIHPGKKPVCQTAAEYQAHQDKLKADNETWCEKRRDQRKSEYDANCRDDKCRVGVGLVVASLSAACIKYANGSKDAFGEPTVNTASQWSDEKKYLANLDGLVKESILRDPNASRQDVLAAYGCKPLLGREDEALCPAGPAFAACKAYVDKGAMKACAEAGNANSRYEGKSARSPAADVKLPAIKQPTDTRPRPVLPQAR